MTIDLSAKDICKIIDSCKRNGVVEFKIEGLSISFIPNYTEPASTVGVSLKAAHKPEPEEVLDELMLSNPRAYEEALDARFEEER